VSGSALISASRSVIYAWRAGGDWQRAAADEAARLAHELEDAARA
jgi:hypothetical protein